jgi:GNAT superfamily N-acetyltransferase
MLEVARSAGVAFTAIREATAQDAPAVAELVWALLEELSHGEPSGYDVGELTSTAQQLLRSGAIAALLAEQDDRAVGVAVLNACASLYAGSFGEITELYVTPAARSSGIGRHLIEAARRFAIARGWSRLEVGTPPLPAWERTARFYERNGFVPVGARMKLPLTPGTT